MKLEDLGLDATNFEASPGHLTILRRDQLLVYDNDNAAQNKPPSRQYYKLGEDWFYFDAVLGTVNANEEVIPAGTSFTIRKAASDGLSRTWRNFANF